jgi:hypothetical protein
MRGRLQAAAAAAAFVAGGWMFALLMPVLSWMSGASIALVTMRHGPLEGAKVSAMAAAMMALFAAVRFETPMPALWVLIAVWLPALICGAVLAATRQQGWMVAVAGVLAAMAAGAVRLATGDVTAWWRQVLEHIIRLATEQGQAPKVEPAALDATAAMLNSLLAGSLLMSLVLTVLLARSWQAGLYNPGGFGPEFRALQLPRWPVTLAMLGLLAWLVIERSAGVPGTGLGYPADLLAIVICALVFHAIALVHHEVRRRQWPLGALVAFYGALLVLPQYVLMMLVALANVDLMLDFRGRKAAAGS